MASLGDVLGAMASQIARGRAQADLATVEIAQLYKEDPILRAFPVPKVEVDEIVVEMKLAISSTPVRARVITPEVKEKILGVLVNHVEKLSAEKLGLKELFEWDEGVQKSWSFIPERVKEDVDRMLPVGVEASSKFIATSAASVVREHLIGFVVKGLLQKRTLEQVREFVQERSLEVKSSLSKQLQEDVENILAAQPVAPDRIDVLVTAAELEGIPPERITTVRLTLREADRIWTKMESEDGSVIERLVSY